jgi:hypothetical protein
MNIEFVAVDEGGLDNLLYFVLELQVIHVVPVLQERSPVRILVGIVVLVQGE